MGVQYNDKPTLSSIELLAIHEFVDSLANKKEICPAATANKFMRLLNKVIEERKKNKEVINENY